MKKPERRKALIVRDALTPEEQQYRLEEMALRHAQEILRRRRERAKSQKPVKSFTKFTQKCKKCGAFLFLLAVEKRKK